MLKACQRRVGVGRHTKWGHKAQTDLTAAPSPLTCGRSKRSSTCCWSKRRRSGDPIRRRRREISKWPSTPPGVESPTPGSERLTPGVESPGRGSESPDPGSEPSMRRARLGHSSGRLRALPPAAGNTRRPDAGPYLPIHAAMSAITAAETWPGVSYSAGVLLPSPSMKRWLSLG